MAMEKETGFLYAKGFFNELNASSYDNIVKFTTFGQDHHWKKKILKKVSTKGLVLDLACGTGILSSLLQDNGNDIFGVDLTYGYLKVLKKKRRELFCINGIAEVLPFKNNYFDYVVSSYLPKYANLAHLVDECFRVLKGGGKVIFHDFIFPDRAVFRKLWKFYFKILKQAGRCLKSWNDVFNKLDSFIMTSGWYNTLPEILFNKGFTNITSESLTFETAAIISAKKP
jgi:demethylmenaquinone methyltransferase/2-methoxy-6-polyprenyl-1,4-benzoquinol methylase